MNIHSLKEQIINSPELIEVILEDAGFQYISNNFKNGDEWRCAWDEDGNPTAVKVNANTLSSQCFSKGVKGDLITLYQERKGVTFTSALRKIAQLINFENTETTIELPFGGFFNEILSTTNSEYGELPILPESTLDEYLIMPSSRFLREGISYDVQKKYKIGYDIMTNRIVIPTRNLVGDLAGIMGRLNKDDIEEWENKYFPLYAFPKSKTLFGFSENYDTIQQQSFVMLFESEKSVMRLESQGVKNALALGGSSLSPFQANNIKSLFPQRVLVCLDEGLDESVSYEMAKQLKIDTFFNNEVGYVYDSENKYLPKGSKMSPADLPLDKFKKLIVECSKKV